MPARRTLPSLVGETFGDLYIEKEHDGGMLRAYYHGKCVCGRKMLIKREYIHTTVEKARKKNKRYCYVCRHKRMPKPHVILGATSRKSDLNYTYRSWESMRYRCLNPNSKDYKNYGGRGISICRSWTSFENFLRDMGKRPEGTSLGRIDNDGPYSPENCSWVSRKEQQNNTRYNVKVGGRSIAEIAEATGLTYNAVVLRLRRGYTEEEIFNTPSGHTRVSAVHDIFTDVGRRNEQLEVIGVEKRLNKQGINEVFYFCRCDCGNIKEITRRNFTRTKSCGCLYKESALGRYRDKGKTRVVDSEAS